MKPLIYCTFFTIFFIIGCSNKKTKSLNFTIQQVTIAPEPVTNNAISIAFINENPYIFSFGGLDSTKLYSGIHQRNYRYDLKNKKWLQLANLPDSLGKIANAASLIKDTIYIIGGYHVFKDGKEVSSNKVHRYAVKNNLFLDDGSPIPTPIDDHVQTVWRDSLIYVVTGWSQKENVPDVQIYNPYKNSWQIGTPVPNTHKFKSFGANGIIVEDTIFYFGGAAMGENFPIQSILRKGVINVNNPIEISWSSINLDSSSASYRMAATKVFNTLHFIGGSATTYNFNGISYNKTGGVSPHQTDFIYKNDTFYKRFNGLLPMDLRGLASVNDTLKYIYGGMEENQKVSNKILQLSWITKH
ncbi:MAG: hypothetical protein GQ540_06540 [Lutibacter sp.]|uniref:Kelch repeat-containing protein n=1 Tax=Lutibacter sp. TaxID=1925666 RepID=UPI0019FF8B98|nr:hypothetical protein [Lutibacter sp.]NOR28169.1 hypothetical protein [Lutibacter sp.]